LPIGQDFVQYKQARAVHWAALQSTDSAAQGAAFPAWRRRPPR
jgi:hypothetical protein